MCAKWRNQAPDALLKALQRKEKKEPGGGRSFDGNPGGVIDLSLSALESFIEFSSELAQGERYAISIRALFEAKSLQAEDVIAQISRSENAFLSKSRQPFFVHTAISMAQTATLRERGLPSVRLSFGEALPAEVLSDLNQRLNRFVPHLVPDSYLSVRAHVKARSVEEAYEAGQKGIDFIRGLWNYCLNVNTGIRITSGRPGPVNKILLGPVRTVHHPTEKLASENLWYNPGYFGAMPLVRLANADWERIGKFERDVRRRIQRSSDPTFLTDLVIRYVRSLDEEILEDTFLKLWTLLEIMTNSAAEYDKTVKRTSRLFAKPDVHAQILQHFRVSRNGIVHRFESLRSVERTVFHLKFYVDGVLRGLLYNRLPLDEFWELLDLPIDIETLEKRIRLAKRAARARKRMPRYPRRLRMPKHK